MIKLFSILFTLCFITSNVVIGAEKTDSPWGQAKSLDIQYEPQKILYDLTTGDITELDNILDRVSLLYKLYDSDVFDSSIVIVIHGDAIPFFAMEKFSQFKKRMVRANSLTVGTSIEFRMCRAAAKVMKYEAKDIHGFVKMIPMADAEIVRLQKNGYAYMR